MSQVLAQPCQEGSDAANGSGFAPWHKQSHGGGCAMGTCDWYPAAWGLRPCWVLQAGEGVAASPWQGTRHNPAPLPPCVLPPCSWSPLPKTMGATALPMRALLSCTGGWEEGVGSPKGREGCRDVSRGYQGGLWLLSFSATAPGCCGGAGGAGQGLRPRRRVPGLGVPVLAGLELSALLLGNGGRRGAAAPLLGVSRGQEQGRAGAGVPRFAHEGEDPAGTAGSVLAATTPAPPRGRACPHRFLVSGGMTASARRFL